MPSDRSPRRSSSKRDRDRDYESSRSHRDSDRDRDRDKPRGGVVRTYRDLPSSYDDFDNKEHENNSSIMLRGMDKSTDEERIRDYLKPFGSIVHIKILRNFNTGLSRGMAFVEFETHKEAAGFIAHHQKDGLRNVSRIIIDGKDVDIKYTRPKTTTLHPPDWTCIRCNGLNFASRQECWTCRSPRSVCEFFPEKECATIAVINLDKRTTKSTVIHYFDRYYPVKSCRLLYDTKGDICGNAFVEFYSIEDARSILRKVINPVIDGVRVKLNFAKHDNSVFTPEHSPERDNRDRSRRSNRSRSPERRDRRSSVDRGRDYYQSSPSKNKTNDTSEDRSHPFFLLRVPDERNYVFDKSKNGYFNAKTNFYYDSDSGYFYETTTGLYYYYDTIKQTYIKYDSEAQIQPSEPQPQPTEVQPQVTYQNAAAAIIEQVQSQVQQNRYAENTTTQNARKPVKDARVAKDINKWNQKSQELAGNSNQPLPYREQPATIIQQPVTQISQPVNPISTGNDEDGEDISDVIARLKAKYEVPTGNICLLCKRSLASTEKLVAHFQVSKLHAENLVKAAEQNLLAPITLPEKRTQQVNYNTPPAKQPRYN